eukprot:5322565-Ditylum_brightwellii.AAC.2
MEIILADIQDDEDIASSMMISSTETSEAISGEIGLHRFLVSSTQANPGVRRAEHIYPKFGG